MQPVIGPTAVCLQAMSGRLLPQQAHVQIR
jgi:hypothetical protein